MVITFYSRSRLYECMKISFRFKLYVIYFSTGNMYFKYKTLCRNYTDLLSMLTGNSFSTSMKAWPSYPYVWLLATQSWCGNCLRSNSARLEKTALWSLTPSSEHIANTLVHFIIYLKTENPLPKWFIFKREKNIIKLSSVFTFLGSYKPIVSVSNRSRP